ncbi:hypothetical protein ACU3L3_07055 [Priestia endophytica]
MNKIKNDPVEFAEKYLGIELQEWQKQILIKASQGETGLYMLNGRGRVNTVWINKGRN